MKNSWLIGSYTGIINKDSDSSTLRPPLFSNLYVGLTTRMLMIKSKINQYLNLPG